jgi:hypothetical protein
MKYLPTILKINKHLARFKRLKTRGVARVAHALAAAEPISGSGKYKRHSALKFKM